MKQEITTELLELIYKRALQYCNAKYGSEPHELHIQDDGSLKVIYGSYTRGEYDEEEYYFNADCLITDLDAIYAERKRNEEEERKKEEDRYRREQEAREIREKEQRRKRYEELKKEFE